GSAKNEEEAELKYDAAWRAALDAALAAGGTLSHHHGVGRSKAPRLGAELGAGVDVVRAVQRVFDPAGILNPGNLLPQSPQGRTPVGAGPSAPELDPEAMLIHAAGETTLGALDDLLRPRGLALPLVTEVPRELSLASFLAEGAPGARDPWIDPVDHFLAGF